MSELCLSQSHDKCRACTLGKILPALLQDMMELHRVSGEKRAAVAASKPAGVECQPNAAAPLLRDEKARREWVEHELDMCCQVSSTSLAAIYQLTAATLTGCCFSLRYSCNIVASSRALLLS